MSTIRPFIERIQPAPTAGSFRMKDYWVWGASPILGDDGRYHIFASRWSKEVTFGHWVTNSEVVRASADLPIGPYQFEEVVLGAREGHHWDATTAHNPTIHYHDGTYLLYYTGANAGCPQPTTKADGPFSKAWVTAWNSKRIGLATAKSVFGPWTRPDGPILETRPNEWDSAITSNAAPCVRDDGSVTLIYKSANAVHPQGNYPGRFRLGVARASHWSQPFERLSDGPIAIAGHPDHHVEDASLWWSGSCYEMICKEFDGDFTGESQAGIHLFSEDAVHWQLGDPAKAYSRTVKWADGSITEQPKLERPQLLKRNNQPTHLFVATMKKGADGTPADTWNCVLPLD